MAEVKGIRYFDISGTLIDSTGLYPAVVVYTKIGIFPITVMLGERVFCTGFYVPAFVTPTDGSSINGGIFSIAREKRFIRLVAVLPYTFIARFFQ